jgi:hypothetical protein
MDEEVICPECRHEFGFKDRCSELECECKRCDGYWELNRNYE